MTPAQSICLYSKGDALHALQRDEEALAVYDTNPHSESQHSPGSDQHAARRACTPFGTQNGIIRSCERPCTMKGASRTPALMKKRMEDGKLVPVMADW